MDYAAEAERHLNLAEECRALAELATDDGSRIHYRKLAGDYEGLADTEVGLALEFTRSRCWAQRLFSCARPGLAGSFRRLIAIGAEIEMIITNPTNIVRIVAAMIAAACWFGSATIKLTRIRPGREELDKVTKLANDLQAMGWWNCTAATFAGIAALADFVVVTSSN